MTLILVGTKADRLFENGLPQEDEKADDLDGIVEETKEEIELLDRIPNLTLNSEVNKSEVGALLLPKVDQNMLPRVSASISPLLEHSDINRVAAHFAKQNGLVSYWRTSSLFGENTKNVFDEAIY